MNDGTHIVDEASLLVISLKQHALVKVAETLIRPDLEKSRFSIKPVSDKPLQRFSDKIEQLGIPKSCQNDIRSIISGLYRHLQNGAIRKANSLTPSTVKFNARGDVDVQRTFDDYMQHICRPRAPRQYLYTFLDDACRFHQEQCVHLILCELAKWKRSGLEPFLRNARPEVEVVKFAKWYCDISFVIEDLVDPAPWKSFVTMLNHNLDGTMFYFRGNILRVSTHEFSRNGKMALLWPKMMTIVKYEYAAEIFKNALDQSDTCLLVQTMHYMDPTNRMHLIKTNLLPFVLCFLKHPYYRHILPNLQLANEDIELLVEEDELECYFGKILSPLKHVGDYTTFSDCLLQLRNYFNVRDKSLGDLVHYKIVSFLYLSTNLFSESGQEVDPFADADLFIDTQAYRFSSWFDNEDEDAKKVLPKLREIFEIHLERGEEGEDEEGDEEDDDDEEEEEDDEDDEDEEMDVY